MPKSDKLSTRNDSPTVVMEFSELIKADQVQLIPEQGHQLARTVVQSVVGLFLAQAS